uniref:Uncharacterized protein n=1 Tax=Glossina pallidipes TaxID=7398 RepID=A0A1A9ZRM5_GLOPL
MHIRSDVVNRKDRIWQTAHVFTKRPEASKTLSGIMLNESEDNAFYEVLMQYTNDQNSLRGILGMQCMPRIDVFTPFSNNTPEVNTTTHHRHHHHHHHHHHRHKQHSQQHYHYLKQ